MEYRVHSRRLDKHSSEARAKNATLILDTDVTGQLDAFNPAELLLASIAACMIKGVERVSQMINFHFSGVHVNLHSVRQNTPPLMSAIYYELIVDTSETEQRLELLHRNVMNYGTISNTIARATKLEGKILKASI